MSKYIFDINQTAGILNPDGGETGSSLLAGLNNNFSELYLGGGGVYSVQADDDISDADWWTTKVLTYNTFLINNDYDFGGDTLTLPVGVALIFNGGIWSNGTISGNNSSLSSYGVRQCFETDLTLSGTWLLDYITPQHYGAKTNSATNVFENDCSAILQKCVDSIFNVLVPTGLYYVATSVVITKTKIIQNIGKSNYSDAVCTTTDHTRFYTDQDIDIFVLRYEDIFILDGIIDYIQATGFSHACIYLDANYYLAAPRLTISCYGSKSKLIAKNQTGNGIYCNLDITTSIGAGSYGCYIGGSFHYNHKAINIPALGDSEMLSFFSIGTINASFWGNRQDLVILAGELFDVTALCQGDGVLELADLPVYAFEIGCTNSVFDLMIVDYGGEIGGFYSPSRLINKSPNNSFINRTRHYSRGFVYDFPAVSNLVPISNPSVTINNNSKFYQGDAFNSFTDNVFYCPQLNIPGTEVAIYDGSGYDFDTKLDSSSGEGLGAPLSLTVTNVALSSFLHPRGQPPFINFVNDNDGLLTDFLEIVIPLTDTMSLCLFDFGIYVASSHYFKRIQFIVKFSDAYDYVTNTYPKNVLGSSWSYRPFEIDRLYNLILTHGAIDKVIIRVIGHNESTGGSPTIIREVFGRLWRSNPSPSIDIAGGQTIYGNLGVNDGVKEANLDVYADNAAAKVGGLVAGDPYRTATGIRMVVYD